MIQQPTLAQVMDANRAHGWHPMAPVMHDNQIEIYLRDVASGTLQGHVKAKNMATRVFNNLLCFAIHYGTDFQVNGGFIVVSNDLTAMHALKTVIRSTYPGTMAATASLAINNVAKTWTFSGTFAAPASNRTFQFVGITSQHGTEYVPSTNNRNIGPLLCGTRLTSPLIQTTTQTLEIVYRIAFTRV